jgi:hypothetical protein
VRLLADTGGPDGWELIATGTVLTAADWPEAPAGAPAPAHGEEQACPYREGRLFHGPAFQYVRSLRTGPDGSSFHLDPAAGSVDTGILAPGLLDAGTHGIPHDDLHLWFPEVGRDVVGYPQVIRSVTFYGPPPAGPMQCEARPIGLAPGQPPRPLLSIHFACRGRLWAEVVLEEVCLPKGPLGNTSPLDRVAFLRDRRFVGGVGLATCRGDATVLERRAVSAVDWLPGTIAAVYATSPAGDLARQVAVKEHVARAHNLHPSAVRWDEGEAAEADGTRFPVCVEDDGEQITVCDLRPGSP